jgi:hypothetical protein
LRPHPIAFASDYRVDRYKFRVLACRGDQQIIVDVPRETVDDIAALTGASTTERAAKFREYRAEFEACARDVIRSQAAGVDRVCLNPTTVAEWRKRGQRQTP